VIKEAFEPAHSSGVPMTTQIPRHILRHFQQIQKPEQELGKLTAREREVLALLAEGYLYKEIADCLCISINTLRTHLRTIYEKLRVHSRTEATVKYLRRGILFNGTTD
jgi:DNA-binding NarL/FixJ family response regulator